MDGIVSWLSASLYGSTSGSVVCVAPRTRVCVPPADLCHACRFATGPTLVNSDALIQTFYTSENPLAVRDGMGWLSWRSTGLRGTGVVGRGRGGRGFMARGHGGTGPPHTHIARCTCL